MLHGLAIVVLSVLVCVVYGVVHDQFTARICLEYFTIGHPRVLPPALETPAMIAFVWGVIATWWVGVLLGVPLALASRVGGWPKRGVMTQLRPLLAVAGCSAVLAVLAGGAGWFAALRGWVFLVPPMSELVPREKHVGFITDLWAHSASYLGGFVGGVALVIRTIRSRRREAQAQDAPTTAGTYSEI